MDGNDWGSQLLSLGVTDFNLLELVELDDGAGQMHDILASFREGIKSHEQSIGCDFPLILSLCFVFEVGILELWADIKG